MKKIYFLVLVQFILSTTQAQIVTIPNANFKAKLLQASPTNQIASTQTPNNKINRLQSYKKNSKILLVLECDNDRVESIEQNIKVIFDCKFKRHNDGYKHYIGDKDEMMKIISIVVCKK